MKNIKSNQILTSVQKNISWWFPCIILHFYFLISAKKYIKNHLNKVYSNSNKKYFELFWQLHDGKNKRTKCYLLYRENKLPSLMRPWPRSMSVLSGVASLTRSTPWSFSASFLFIYISSHHQKLKQFSSCCCFMISQKSNLCIYTPTYNLIFSIS